MADLLYNFQMKQLVFSPSSLGSAIARRRKALKLNQKQAGGSFRIEQSTVSNIEQGRPGIHIDTIFRMLAALDLEMVIQAKPVSDEQE